MSRDRGTVGARGGQGTPLRAGGRRAEAVRPAAQRQPPDTRLSTLRVRRTPLPNPLALKDMKRRKVRSLQLRPDPHRLVAAFDRRMSAANRTAARTIDLGSTTRTPAPSRNRSR